MKIVWVAGARPNFMKIAPIWRAMASFNSDTGQNDRHFSPVLVHTGQHYSANMSDVFFKELQLPAPDYHLGVGGGSHAGQVARILVEFERILGIERPDAVGVVGDVDSTCACALATKKAYVGANGGTPLLVHVEAGLRSGDRLMPEEINRLVTDSIADVLFTSEPSGSENLRAEGVVETKIHFVGNVMVDSLLDTVSRCDRPAVLERLGLFSSDPAKPYGLVTLHRPSNVDEGETLLNLFGALSEISRRVSLLFPVHPRTRARLDEINIESGSQLRVLDPLGYLDFVALMTGAAFVITDSGGIQEETTALGIPCLTMRENTERPATVTEGTNKLLGRRFDLLAEEVDAILDGRGKRGRVPALWDGKAAERIVAALANLGAFDS